jgi:Rieske Fe-S protein
MPIIPHGLCRRTFLKVLAGAAATEACSSPAASGPTDVGDVPAGNISSVTQGSLAVVPGAPVCIGRDAKGVYSMTLTCTHQGCDMGADGSVSVNGIVCACHGSEFDADGNVVRGPARAPLAHFAVSQDAKGELTVHTGSEVDANTRLSVG